MSDNIINSFENYYLKADLSWFGEKNPVNVKMFTYHLSQYTPSVYAEIILIINSKFINEFKKIDILPIKERKINVWFEPELYNLRLKKKYFSGPFSFCVLQYELSSTTISEMDSNFTGLDDAKIVVLKCIDPVFYQMTLDQKITSFGKVSASEVVKKIVNDNGGKVKNIQSTNYPFQWLQTQKTDYEMIRSLLPYAQSTNGDLMYTFFVFNKEAYFCPISAGKKTPTKLILDDIQNKQKTYSNSDLKYLIELYGSKDNVQSTHHGFSNFENVTPVTMNTQSFLTNKASGKQHDGQAKRYINTAFEDKKLQEIYVSNVRQRVHTFSRLLYVTSEALPEITPINCIEIVNDKNGESGYVDGLYYVASVKYNFGMTQRHPITPSMELCLCSEIDVNGSDSPEGKGI